ncbi:hypothetical protein PV08_01502 [Exophiala spinifera]|uniref:Uncharacterized protein n=1 Tax=Exophiala spinifera TaxID=91928 RepID=A0A0D2BPN6_9EURO|nr:uncharacterized protein PV08_01502 [Exophiala spinifera]KIW20923.1 hypothetical protein PV08_01502 [Exophiala spinifera]
MSQRGDETPRARDYELFGADEDFSSLGSIRDEPTYKAHRTFDGNKKHPEKHTTESLRRRPSLKHLYAPRDATTPMWMDEKLGYTHRRSQFSDPSRRDSGEWHQENVSEDNWQAVAEARSSGVVARDFAYQKNEFEHNDGRSYPGRMTTRERFEMNPKWPTAEDMKKFFK